ncbi:hypothetical protein PR048_013068 [Dryococelus australis]|uniref:Uncharacterized protein n=1 Tax=Dryococelus australis TaxID=614101 RepID=A0ABQ9HRB0_9NEOP|nr:hypothetical protein PR048_013068 [Dryococelus australis]
MQEAERNKESQSPSYHCGECSIVLCVDDCFKVYHATKHALVELFFGRRLLHPLINAWSLNGPEWGSVEPKYMETLWKQVATN